MKTSLKTLILSVFTLLPGFVAAIGNVKLPSDLTKGATQGFQAFKDGSAQGNKAFKEMEALLKKLRQSQSVEKLERLIDAADKVCAGVDNVWVKEMAQILKDLKTKEGLGLHISGNISPSGHPLPVDLTISLEKKNKKTKKSKPATRLDTLKSSLTHPYFAIPAGVFTAMVAAQVTSAAINKKLFP